MTRSAFSWCLIPAAQNPPEVVVAQKGQKALMLLAQAGALGYWGVQVGRVNSARRVQACVALGADSCDGTSLRFTGVERGLRDVQGWVEAGAGQPGLFDLARAM